jgi:hypothetical protein
VRKEPSSPHHYPAGQRPPDPSADCTQSTPTRAVQSCDGTPPPTVTGRELLPRTRPGSRTEKFLLEGSRDGGALSSGAACDRWINGASCARRNKAASGSSPSKDAACRVAITKRELEMRHVKTDQPDSPHIPKPKSNPPDPRSLQRADVSSVMKK